MSGLTNRRQHDMQLDELKDEIKNLREAIQKMFDKQNILDKTISEIHQRQTEVTHKELSKISKCLFGNGEKGLFEEHIVCKNKLKSYSDVGGKITGIIVTLVIYFIAFVYGYGVLTFKVNYLWGLIVK